MTKGSRSALGFACAATLFSASASAVTVNWVDGTGFWDLVANWSPSQLPSSADDVVINVTGQQTITHRTGTTQIRSLANTGDEIVAITNGSSLTVAANALSPSTNAGTLRVTGTGSRLRFSGSTLNNTGGTLDAQDGALVELLQGTIIGGTLTTSGSGVIRALAGSYGTLDAVTLNGTYLVGDGSANSNSYLRNSLLNNGVVALSSGAAGGLATTLLLDGDVTVSGTGAITLSDSAANQFRGNFGTELLTNAVGHTIQGAGTINSLSVTNRGTISATHGTPLIVQPSGTGSVLNTGSLQATGGGVLRLQFGTYTNFEGASNGTIQAFDNSVVEFAEGSNVVGGILSTTGSGQLRSRPGTTSTLDGVTLNGNYLAGDGSSNTRTRLRGAIVNNGTFTLGSGLNGGLVADLVVFGTDVTLSGTGTLTMANGSGNQIYGASNTLRLTNSASHTIRGSGNIGGATLALTNQGLIAATQDTPLIIQPNSSGVINTGTLRADGGTLDLRGLFTNTGGLLDARNGSVLQLTNATVAGGTLTTSGGGLMRTTPGQLGRLDGVTLNGTYVAGDGSSNTTTQLVGTITNNGTLAMNSGVNGGLTTSMVLYQSDVTLAGSGVLAMANSGDNIISGFNNNERLTNSASHTIAGSGNIGFARMTLTNQGLIAATQDTPLIIQPNSSGVINTGTLRADGGTLDLRGLFTNTGGLLDARNGSVLQLTNATVAGGTLTTSGGGLMRTTPGQLGRLDGVTLNGTYVAGDGSSNTTTQLVGTITNNGTLAMNSGVNGGLTTSMVLYQSDVTLAGSGVLAMANSGDNIISGFNNNERLTNSASHTIAGSGNIGFARMTLTNQGLIAATQATRLIVQPNSSGVINTGTLRADGGTLELRGLFTNTGGTLDARNGSILELGNATVVSGTLTSSTGGALRTRPGTIGQLDAVTLNGTYVAGDGTSNTTTRLVNTITNNGTLAMNSGVGGGLTTSLVLYQSDVTLAGNGTLAMANSTANVINDVNGNEILTNAAGHTIQGAGRILVNLQNAGTVRASGTAGLLANRGIIGPSGTVEIAPDGILTLAAASSAGTLLHNGSAAGSLALGANSVTIHGDYNNASFGLGNAFNARANVSGTGQILAAGNTTQAITGAAIANGTSATPTLTIGNVRVGANTFDFQVANTGTTGPALRGAIQTAVNGGNITDPRLAVAAQNFGPIAVGGSSGNLGVSFNVASAGALAPLSGQAIHVANNFGNVPSQTINLALGAGAAAYVPAAGQLNTSALNFGTVQVGQGVSQSLSISNIATGPAGFVEDLNAGFGTATGVGASLITGTGSINGLLAGGTNAASMVVSVNTAAAGTVSGAIPINFFTAGAVGGASNGLGVASVGSADFGVTGTIQAIGQVVDQAQPVINNPVINLGNVRINTASPTQFVSVTNQATGNAQAALNAGISASAPVTASGSFNLLAPGGTNASALQVGLNTSTAGARSGTATVAFVSDASNVGGCEPNCQLTLASQNVTVQGNVFRLAQGQATELVTLPNFRVGNSTSGTFTVTNIAANDGFSERLNANVSGTGGAVSTATGSVSLLGAGSSSNAIGALIVGGVAGANVGTVTVAYQSDGAGTTGAPAIGVGNQTVSVQATGYNVAAGGASPSPITFANQRVGGTLAQALTVTNTASAGAYTEVLNASFGASTGAATSNGGSISGGLNAGGVAAGGPGNSTAMTAGLDTSAAGARSGSVTLNYISNGAGTSGLAPISVGSQTINVSGNVYQVAAGQLNTPALNFGTVQVGQGVSQSLSISNIATGPAGYVEDLNAGFGAATGVGASLITGTGSINGLLAGGTNAASMVVSVNTATAGTVSGAIPVNFFTAGAVGGASNGLGVASVGSANFGVTGTIQAIGQVVDQAQPVINNPVISLGNVRINTASPTQFVSVTNQATGNAQAALNAGISASAPVTASGSFNLLAPGGTNASALQVGLNTSTAGARSGTATVAFVSDASNVGGCEPNCQLTLASQNVTVQGNVFRLADPVLGTSSISLAARVGDAAPSAGVVLSNSSPDIYTEGLSSAISTAAAGFTASGAIANLAAGASNTSTLRVQLDTSTAGTFGGTAELALASTGAGTTGAADLALPGQSANLSGKVYTPAVAQVATASIDFGIVHVGDAVASQSLTVTNAAAQSALNDVLRGSIGGVAGPFTASGTLGDGLAAGQTDSSSLAVSLGTAAAGIFSGSATASFVSHDADLVDLGLGTTSISLAGQVNNYADPRFIKDSGAGTLTSAALIYHFDFGTLSPGSGMLEGFLTLSNAAAGPADLLRGSYEFDFGSSQDFGLFGFQSFDGLAAGQGQSGLRIAFNTDGLGLGTYEDSIRLLSVGYNDSGYQGAFSPILLLVRGTVGAKPVPEPGTLLLLMYGLASLALACSRRSAAVRRDAATMAPERKARNAC